MTALLTRRDALAALAAALAVPAHALIDVDDTLSSFTGGKPVAEGRVSIEMEDVIADGFTVPISLKAESAMTEAEYVTEILLLAPANPFGKVAVYSFTPLSGEARVATRIRLAGRQTLIAIAKYADGTCWAGRKSVEVQTNGCEG